MSTILQKPKLQKLLGGGKQKRIKTGQIWVKLKIGFRKTQPRYRVQSGESPSPRQTSTDQTNGCVMNCERGALVRGSDPPQEIRAFATTGEELNDLFTGDHSK